MNRSEAACSSVQLPTSFTKSRICSDHMWQPWYSMTGFSLQPKPSMSSANTLWLLASSGMLYRQWYTLAPKPWMRSTMGPLLPVKVSKLKCDHTWEGHTCVLCPCTHLH